MNTVWDKRGLEFGFVWIFSIIAGVSILLLSIYGATQIGETQRFETDASVAKKLTIITDPLEAGFTSATFGTISFNAETRVRNLCNAIGFGANDIAAATKSGFGSEWLDYSAATTVREKYIFGHEEDSGETFYVLSKAFNFPYKIADYVVLMTDQRAYCFIDAPKSIREELEALRMPVIGFDNCTFAGDVEVLDVCFGGGTCDIVVEPGCDSCTDVYGSGLVRYPNGRSSQYAGSLLYPAIFSDKITYECDVQRLLYRGGTTAKILARKADLMNARGCSTNLEPVLQGWSTSLLSSDISGMVNLYPDALALEGAHKWEVCGVW